MWKVDQRGVLFKDQPEKSMTARAAIRAFFIELQVMQNGIFRQE